MANSKTKQTPAGPAGTETTARQAGETKRRQPRKRTAAGTEKAAARPSLEERLAAGFAEIMDAFARHRMPLGDIGMIVYPLREADGGAALRMSFVYRPIDRHVAGFQVQVQAPDGATVRAALARAAALAKANRIAECRVLGPQSGDALLTFADLAPRAARLAG